MNSHVLSLTGTVPLRSFQHDWRKKIMMHELLESLPPGEKESLKECSPPSSISPMLATLTDDYFSDDQWLYERKLDGERCLTFMKEDEVTLKSRNDRVLNATYPEIVDTFQDEDDLIMDGEIVAFEDDLTSFSALQERMHIDDEQKARESDVDVYYYVFDLLYVSGYDITGVSLTHRKSLLKQICTFEDPLRYVTHRVGQGVDYYREACEKGWEGVIAKRKDSTYIQKRSTDWLKFKCIHRQEFVIGGYTDPHGERVGFGALLIGYYEGDDLLYAGKVGTGFDEETLKLLHDTMEGLHMDHTPFVQEDLPSKEIHWIRPELVAEIGFTEWTSAGKLRHPRFLGLRRDKEAHKVVREQPGGST
jgi:bifunctional non-homologous end joining protein LigD